MSQITLTVDDREIKAESGERLIDLLLREKVHIPHFCYHPAIGMDGNCRQCMVEIEGQKRPQIACDTYTKDGMIVRTKSKMIDKVKKDILELELINHPIDCPTCDQAGECKLQDYYMSVGGYESRIETAKVHKHKAIELGSNVMLDQERCVACALCVRFCKNVTKTSELGFINRGDHVELSIFPGTKLDNPYAMNVVDLCPVGALTSADFRFKERVWFLKSANSICHGCAKGCNIYIDHNKEKYKDDMIYRYRPRVNNAVNGWFICNDGRLSYHKENENRQTVMLNFANEISEQDAMSGFKTLLEQNKNGIAFVVSPSMSLEEMFAINTLASSCGAVIVTNTDAYKSGEDDEVMAKLIKQDKSANKKGAELLGFKNDLASYENAIKNSSLVVVFDHKVLSWKLEISGKKLVIFTTSQTELSKNADYTFAIASYSEKDGLLINCDGRVQYFNKAVSKNAPLKNLCELVEAKSSSEVRTQMFASVGAFKDVNLDALYKDGITLQGGQA